MTNKTQNPKSKSVFYVLFGVLLISIFYFLFSPVAFAQGNVLDILRGRAGLVPCGTSYTGNVPCTVCHVFQLIQNIINLLTYLAIALGTIAALVIGFRFLIFGSNPKKIEETKTQFGWLVAGIVIVLGSWLLLNTIFNVVASGNFKFWNTISCEVSQNKMEQDIVSSAIIGAGVGVLPIESGSNISGWEILDSPGYADGIDINTAGYTQYLNEPPEGSGLKTAEPGSAKLADYNKKIDEYAASATNLNGMETNRVKAIIQAESSGNLNAVHRDLDGKSSYGLMQIRPDTARLYDSSLKGMSDYDIGQKLMNDTQYNMDMGTKHYNNLYQKYGDHTLAAAAYNGGVLANKSSVNCPGLRRWQCLWDNNEHTLPNERPGHPGYGPTRRYMNNIDNVYSQLSK